MNNQFVGEFSRVGERLALIQARIAAVERPFEHDIEVIPVTKGFSGDAIEAAVAAGCRTVGENYAQDLLSKADVIGRLGVDVQFIGHLQSNKVRQLIDIVSLWCTIDRRSILNEVAKRASGAHVLIQVNATDEPQKGGCRPAEVATLVDQAGAAGLVVDGLMTIGPTGEPPAAARRPFEIVRALVDEHELAVCSMGMSADIEVAVECGSTQVRVGSALFGPRPVSTIR
jgi:pyridoxal phosphate enzyme (YggS family)